jgi:hypothetical protein
MLNANKKKENFILFPLEIKLKKKDSIKHEKFSY